MLRRVKTVHFVGIGGIGMSGIAEVMLNLGFEITGSDLRESDTTRRLVKLGAKVYLGHHPENLGEPQVVVYSSAVKADNPELLAARARRVPVVARGEMLAELMRMKYGIAVTGAHGKTTTTSLITAVLAGAGLDPTAVIGGKVRAMGSNAKLGKGKLLVCEADESDGTFLKMSPTVVVMTNIDAEHLDHYRNIEEISATFRQFVEKIPFYGYAVICWDDPRLRALMEGFEHRYLSYGLHPEATFRAEEVTVEGFSSRFTVYRGGERLGRVRLVLPGLHNVVNCLAAIAVAAEEGVGFKQIGEALRSFGGVERRFQVKGNVAGITVVDDYAHHPQEIKATLRAARGCTRNRVMALFQPHRYTRMKALFDQFAGAFEDVDVLLVTDIYPAGEEPIPGVEAVRLVEAMLKNGKNRVAYIPDRELMLERACQMLAPGDLAITLGAGDIWSLSDALVERLKQNLKVGNWKNATNLS